MNALIKQLSAGGFIEAIDAGTDQVIKNIKRAKHDIKDGQATLAINPELTFNCAYNAMLHAGRALLFCYRYRPRNGQQHLTVVRFSEAVLGNKYQVLTIKYNKIRQKRNTFLYDVPDWDISEQEATDALKTSKEFVEKIIEVIEHHDPQMKMKL